MRLAKITPVFVLAAALTGALALGGCAKKKECESLSEVIKAERDALGKNSDATTAEDFAKMAKAYEDVSKKVKGVEVTDAGLKTARDKYTDFIDDMAAAANATKDAKASSMAPDKVAKAKSALDKIEGRSERDLYLDLLRYCTE